jgi:hypothetical protein
MLTQSYMSAEDQQRYRDRAAVSFMYTKPPGLDAALARDKEREAAEAKVGDRWGWLCKEHAMHGLGVGG